MKKVKYVGSKARVAKFIAPMLNDIILKKNIKIYIEPFVGGSNMIEHIKCEKKIGCDNNEYLIEFWKAIQSGWNPLETVNMIQDLYHHIKDNKELYPKEVVALAGLCATYNAKWFGGYAGIVKTKIGTMRNYYDEAVRNVLKQRSALSNVEYRYCDYHDIKADGALIYCDPPYEGTVKYKDDFSHPEYWNWVKQMSKNNIILCSEYNAPDGFVSVWEKEITTTLDKSSRSAATEKLFKVS